MTQGVKPTDWLLYLEGSVTGCDDEEADGFIPLTISLMELLKTDAQALG